MWKFIKKYFKDSVILTNDVTQTNENETNEQRGGCLGMLLGGTLEVSLLRNLLSDKM